MSGLVNDGGFWFALAFLLVGVVTAARARRKATGPRAPRPAPAMTLRAAKDAADAEADTLGLVGAQRRTWVVARVKELRRPDAEEER